MPNDKSQQHLLPRPVSKLPDYASPASRRSLAERLSAAFGLSFAVGTAISNAVVDPSAVRKAIGDPEDPQSEKIAVPGGTLYGLRTQVWSRRIMPDPRNPRTLPSRRHPFAVDPGTSGEDSKFRPVPEPRSTNSSTPQLAELTVDIDSREHLNWASQQAATFVRADNNWEESIRHQGVMQAVWLVATTYSHADGSEPAIALTTAEGSSRTTAVHEILHVRSADVPYEFSEVDLRANIRKLNSDYDQGANNDEQEALRNERMPALILVGFKAHQNSSTEFSTAVKSMVALRHVDSPKPWGDGPENEALADEVLDELYRRGLISDIQRSYLAGACTRKEAEAAHLPSDPSMRAAMIMKLFTGSDEKIIAAVRSAVTSQSTRKRVTTRLTNELGTALILRAVSDDPKEKDRTRRYMLHAFHRSVHRDIWNHTFREPDQLIKDALLEVRAAIAEGDLNELGPSSIELMVRSAYALIVSGRLNAERHFDSADDRRSPSDILNTMRHSIQGIYQLGQSLKDYSDDGHIRAVDEDGLIKHDDEGEVIMVNDLYLRGEFPSAGKARTDRPGDTPLDHYENKVSALSEAFERLRRAYKELNKVDGDNGRPLVDARGVESQTCNAWRSILNEIDEDLVVWNRTYKKAFGVGKPKSVSDDTLDDLVDEWDASEENE